MPHGNGLPPAGASGPSAWNLDSAGSIIASMNMDTIREWLNRQPFEPFVLRMSNGEVHEVRHPECMAIGKTRMAVSYPEQDRMVHLSLIHVNAIKAVQATK